MSHDPGNGTQEPPIQYCPVLGVVVIPVPTSQIVRGPQDVQLSPVMSKCVKEQCVMWDGTEKNCTLKLAAEALISLKAKMSLTSLFGGKKV